MSLKSHHVVPDPVKGWNVKKGGSSRSSAHADTKETAIKIAREISQNQGTELKIHNLNGRISQSDSHGKDSFPLIYLIF